MKQEFLPAGTVYQDPNVDVPEDERVGRRVIYTPFLAGRTSAELAAPSAAGTRSSS